jgi:hypothetical protein
VPWHVTSEPAPDRPKVSPPRLTHRGSLARCLGGHHEINLPGVGSVIFFETNTSISADQIRGQVIMIHVELDFATADLPAGTEIRIAFARTQVETP